MADSTSHCKLMLHKIGSGFWLDIQVLGNIGHPRYIISYQLAEVLDLLATGVMPIWVIRSRTLGLVAAALSSSNRR